MIAFRIREGNLTVVKVEGPNAEAAIWHYARQYRKPDDIAEEAAILDIYKTAMGMLCQWPLPK